MDIIRSAITSWTYLIRRLGPTVKHLAFTKDRVLMEGERVKRLVLKMILVQLGLILLVGLVLFLLVDVRVACSGLVGGMIWLLPNYHMAQGLMNLRRGLNPEDRLRKIYLRSAFKIIYSVALFLIAIIFLKVDFLVTAAAYLLLALSSGFSFRYSESDSIKK